MMSIICNKGYSYKPHILKEIRSPVNGTLLKKIIPEKFINLENYNKEVFNELHRSLRYVITAGTTMGIFAVNPVKIAGKTGTAEVFKSNNNSKEQEKTTHSWFAGFGPIDAPLEDQIVVAVLIEYENNN